MRLLCVFALLAIQCATVPPTTVPVETELAAREAEATFTDPIAPLTTDAKDRRIHELERTGLALVTRYRALAAELAGVRAELYAEQTRARDLAERAAKWDGLIGFFRRSIGLIVALVVLTLVGIAGVWYWRNGSGTAAVSQVPGLLRAGGARLRDWISRGAPRE